MQEAESAPGREWLELAIQKQLEGNWPEAEELLWKGLALRPTHWVFYFNLADVRRKQNQDDPLNLHLMRAGLRHLASMMEVPEAASRHFAEALPDVGEFGDPEDFNELLDELEESPLPALPAAEQERFQPYDWLSELHYDCDMEIFHPDTTISACTAQAERCTELACAVLRSFSVNKDELDPFFVPLLAAAVGEYGPATAIGELWDIPSKGDNELTDHKHWALCRMDERFPEESIRAIRAHIPAADSFERCAIADHLSMMGRRPEIAAGLMELLDGLEKFASTSDAGYIVAAVHEGLADQGEVDRSQAVLERYRPMLEGEGREELEELLGSAEGYVPALENDIIKGKTLEEILGGALFEGYSDHDEFEDEEFEDEFLDDEEDFEDEEFDDEYFVEQVVAAPRPGRNDPCWCGSGKKYKKCHLDSDERGETSPPGTGARHR